MLKRYATEKGQIAPGLVNRTKPNQKQIESNLSIGVPINAIGSILFGRKTKWYTKIDKHSLSVELEGFHSLTDFYLEEQV